jgi:MYXO-CTERM domain-containing protein
MKRAIAAACLAGVLTLTGASVVSAQDAETTTESEGGGDEGIWGLAGLLGLVGLAGLKRNDRARTDVRR